MARTIRIASTGEAMEATNLVLHEPIKALHPKCSTGRLCTSTPGRWSTVRPATFRARALAPLSLGTGGGAR